MKKLAILFGIIGMCSLSAQDVQFGIKAGLDYPSNNGVLQAVTTVYEDRGDNSVGFHIGAFGRLGLGGVFLQPELLYTQFTSEFENQANTRFDVTRKRIDLPVLLGKKFLGLANLKFGPVVSYYFDDNIDLNTVRQIEQENLALGLQFGAGVEISKIHIDLRYEQKLGDVGTAFSDDLGTFQLDNTPNLLRLSVGFSF